MSCFGESLYCTLGRIDECKDYANFISEYHELGGSASCSGSSSNDEGDGEPTPCNSPKEIRKSHPVSLSLPLTTLSAQNGLIRNQPPTSTLQRQSNGNR